MGQQYDAKADLWSVGVILYGESSCMNIFKCSALTAKLCDHTATSKYGN